MLNAQFWCWSFMSEVDRVFPPRAEELDVAKAGEKRFIQATSRKRGLGSAQTRTVEVVHLRSTRSKPAGVFRHRVVARQHAESWPDGFRAKTAGPDSTFNAAPFTPGALATHSACHGGMGPVTEATSGSPAASGRLRSR
jgi:hypothetical protein